MKLQEKIREFIRESDLVEEDVLKKVINALPKNRISVEDSFLLENTFISGSEYAYECVLRLLEDFKINPEIYRAKR